MDQRTMVSDSEWKIMELLWQNDTLTMTEITQMLSKSTGWSKHTVISLLKRMCAKGSAQVVPGTSPMAYRALITRQEAVRQETHQVLRKVFGGKSTLLISQLVQQDDFSDDEIDELMQLLDAKRGDKR